MLYYLLPPLASLPYLGFLNVTRYITFRTAAASLTALVLGLCSGCRANCATSRSVR